MPHRLWWVSCGSFRSSTAEQTSGQGTVTRCRVCADFQLLLTSAPACAEQRAFSLGYNASMGFFFPEDGLKRLPPGETRILSVDAEPYPDGERVRVNLKITPFETRPHIDVSLTDVNGDEVAAASIVEPMSWQLELTLHLRGATASPFTVSARLFYPDGPQAEPVTVVFESTRPT